ncbi:unnamed protein product [Linum tenue]|uniref:MADS-box domain-containing protein n=1 Tax=Linum tenue TaxID=586396 RepID=A0AAV0M905_9ROSI|nr:unnamed protein product [Linum tenue]
MSRAPSLKKRRRTLKKKAEELSTLCGIDVAYVCFDPNGRVDTWPEDPNRVKDIVLRYGEVKSNEKPSAAGGSSASSSDGGGSGSSRGEIQGAAETVGEPKLDGLSEEELLGGLRLVEEKLEKVRRRIGVLEGDGESRKKRRRRNCDLPTLNLIDLVGLPPRPANSEAENRCSSSSGASSSSPSRGSSMVTGTPPPERSNSATSDPKSEWGTLISL